MTDDVTTGEGAREREPRPATTAGGTGTTRSTGSTGTTRSTDPTDPTGIAGTTGTQASVVAGHDRAEGTEGRRSEGRAPGLGIGEGPGTVADKESRYGKGGKASASPAPPGGGHLLPHEECDKLSLRLQHAVGDFVDGPRSAVEEADHVLEEVTSRFADAVTQRRRTLRATWQTTGEDRPASADTEQLRLALRDYRELTERLLRL